MAHWSSITQLHKLTPIKKIILVAVKVQLVQGHVYHSVASPLLLTKVCKRLGTEDQLLDLECRPIQA